MTISLRRTAAALAVPAVLMLTLTACGEDSDAGSSDTSSRTAESETADSSAADETPTEEETPSEEAPSEDAPGRGAVPDPTEDPEGFKDYIAKTYTDAGMTKEQATCMADAFVDNVDLSSISDPSAVSELMNDAELQSAMMECV